MVNRKVVVFETELGTYSAVEVIGEGGSGRVYRATSTAGEFAIKVLDSARATSLKVKRFKNELNFCRLMRHDHIVPVLDSGETEIGGKTTPFFVMPKYEGSLRALMPEERVPSSILRLFDGLLLATAFAHGRKVWHRDVKPENVFFDAATDRLLLGDFGIAHFEEDDLHTAVETRDAERLANFQYAAPEQRIKGGTVDYRADIYALGLMLNEWFTGSVPQGTGYRRIEAVAPRYDYLDTVVERMIRNDPAERYETVDDVRRDMRLLATGPGLTKGLQVAAKVTAATEKARLFRSEEGVSRASLQVEEAYGLVLDLLTRIREEAPSLKLQFERAGDELVARSGRASARMNWYHSYSNVLDEARVTIWKNRRQLLLPSERGSHWYLAEPEEVGESAFYPDYTAEHGLCWVDKSRQHLTAGELGNRLFEEFMHVVERYELAVEGEDE